MTKAQVYHNVTKEVEELLSSSKVDNGVTIKVLDILKEYLAPKAATQLYPPKLNDNGEIVEAYCRFHQRYEPIEDMVVSKDKPKGYCKASISLWNKTNAQIKKLDKEAVDAMVLGDFDKAQELANKSKELKEKLNSPDLYNYEIDWAVFRGNAKD